MTVSTINRIRKLYAETIGYDPIEDGWTAAEALEVLREYRAETRHNAI